MAEVFGVIRTTGHTETMCLWAVTTGSRVPYEEIVGGYGANTGIDEEEQWPVSGIDCPPHEPENS